MTKGVNVFMAAKKERQKIHTLTLANTALESSIELTSNKEALIEGCSGIVEYNDTLVTVNCKNNTVTIEGADINLKTLASDVVEVTGQFKTISFNEL